MKLEIENEKEPKEKVVVISLERDGGDVNILANGYLIAWIQEDGTANHCDEESLGIVWED